MEWKNLETKIRVRVALVLVALVLLISLFLGYYKIVFLTVVFTLILIFDAIIQMYRTKNKFYLIPFSFTLIPSIIIPIVLGWFSSIYSNILILLVIPSFMLIFFLFDKRNTIISKIFFWTGIIFNLIMFILVTISFLIPY